jgi:aminoglycoside phosphotransferase (APT) family kinase protein
MTNFKNKLQTYTRKAFPDLTHPQVTDLNEISQSWESEMYAFDLLSGPEEIRQRQELVLRLYPSDNGAEKASREYNSMRGLHLAGYPVPWVLNFGNNSDSLGNPFIIMERIPGEQMWSLMEQSPPERQAELMAQFCQLFLDLHNLDWRLFVEDPTVINPYTFVDGWFQRTEDTLEYYDLPDFEPLVAWLRN